MNDNKSCETCRYVKCQDTDIPCCICRNAHIASEKASYDSQWEAAEEEREFVPGETVLWGDDECKVLSVRKADGVKMLEVLKIDVDRGNSGEFMLSRHMIPASQCGKQVKEMTDQEYAEKLRQHFRVQKEYDMKCTFCTNIDCEDCAFYGAPEHCLAAVCLFDPETALEMIRNFEEARKPEKPKKKSYLDDFREKFPNAEYLATGSPVFCRNNLYFAGKACTAKPCPNCCDCWNEVMPEEGQG